MALKIPKRLRDVIIGLFRSEPSAEEEARQWLDADLSRMSELEPYDWGDADPDTLGEPIDW